MKIRKGFVTNSSSSSFIIAFKKKEYMQKLKISAEALSILKDEESETNMKNVLKAYREYLEDNLYNPLHVAINKEFGIPFYEIYEKMEELKKTEEYQKVYADVYERNVERKVRNLENKLQENELILLVHLGDEYDEYEEIYKMEEVIAVMDYH